MGFVVKKVVRKLGEGGHDRSAFAQPANQGTKAGAEAPAVKGPPGDAGRDGDGVPVWNAGAYEEASRPQDDPAEPKPGGDAVEPPVEGVRRGPPLVRAVSPWPLPLARTAGNGRSVLQVG